jgi:hypothetical protein
MFRALKAVRTFLGQFELRIEDGPAFPFWPGFDAKPEPKETTVRLDDEFLIAVGVIVRGLVGQ